MLFSSNSNIFQSLLSFCFPYWCSVLLFSISFFTLHRSKDYGFVNPKFYKRFRRELTEVWRLIDTHKNHKVVLFEVNKYGPKITIGWEELRLAYKLNPDDSVYMRYLGLHDGSSAFHISIIKSEQPQPPSQALQQPQSPIDTDNPSTLPHSINWEVTLTHYQAKASQLV